MNKLLIQLYQHKSIAEFNRKMLKGEPILSHLLQKYRECVRGWECQDIDLSRKR